MSSPSFLMRCCVWKVVVRVEDCIVFQLVCFGGGKIAAVAALPPSTLGPVLSFNWLYDTGMHVH